MGKKRIITKEGGETDAGTVSSKAARAPKKKIVAVTLHIEATFNNTLGTVTDKTGNVLFASSAGALGFKGAKKGTPFAAGKAGEVLSEKCETLGVKEFDAIIRGVGSGREPMIRAFLARNFELTGVRDMTPIPHNGPKQKKPRRV